MNSYIYSPLFYAGNPVKFIQFCRAAHEAGAATAIVNIGVTRADDVVPLKISARCGEVEIFQSGLIYFMNM